MQSDENEPTATEPPVKVRNAATVALVRDGDCGIEVFMLRRSLQSAFVGGAYVFPGGAVDDADHPEDIEHLCVGLSDVDASERLGVERGGLSYWVAAVRESFEEAGVLLAVDGSDQLISFADPDVERRFLGWRSAVDAGTRSIRNVCEAESLRLATDRMHYFSHWITPLGAPRRFDTRFFVCAAPTDQVPLHDDRETIANTWIRPAEALQRHHDGEFFMILPTIKTLEAIGRFPSADQFLTAANQIGEVPTIMPRLDDNAEPQLTVVSRP